MKSTTKPLEDPQLKATWRVSESECSQEGPCLQHATTLGSGPTHGPLPLSPLCASARAGDLLGIRGKDRGNI